MVMFSITTDLSCNPDTYMFFSPVSAVVIGFLSVDVSANKRTV